MNPKNAQAWLEAHAWAQNAKGIPTILAQEAAKRAGVALRKAKPYKAPVRAPRGVKIQTAQAAKKDLRKELEALCKAIVFTRDCGSPEAREGNCISCGRFHVLQWGHFIRQQDSKWLQFDPRNTAGQCARCNMNGGYVLEYAKAIDNRDGTGAALHLQQEAARMGAFWRPNKTTLGEMLRNLQAHPLAPKARAPGATKDP